MRSVDELIFLSIWLCIAYGGIDPLGPLVYEIY